MNISIFYKIFLRIIIGITTITKKNCLKLKFSSSFILRRRINKWFCRRKSYFKLASSHRLQQFSDWDTINKRADLLMRSYLGHTSTTVNIICPDVLQTGQFIHRHWLLLYLKTTIPTWVKITSCICLYLMPFNRVI